MELGPVSMTHDVCDVLKLSDSVELDFWVGPDPPSEMDVDLVDVLPRRCVALLPSGYLPVLAQPAVT